MMTVGKIDFAAGSAATPFTNISPDPSKSGEPPNQD
jgi:hypothetical protein